MLQRITNSVIFNNNLLFCIQYNASKMQASSTSNTKDSAGKRLGLKKWGGQQVYPGDIIARQRGFKWKSGLNTIVGKDQTIHSKIQGVIKFSDSKYRKVPYKIIDIIPKQLPNRQMKHPPAYNYHPELFPQRSKKNHPPMQKLNRNTVTYEGIEKLY